MLILILLCLSLPVTAVEKLKAQSRVTLSEMQNVIATQELTVWGYGQRRTKSSSTVGSYRRELTAPAIGVRPGSEWIEFVRLLPFFNLEPEGEGFKYSGNCDWSEPGFQGLVPCEGRIEVDDDMLLQRMTQVLHPERTVKEVVITVNYGWVTLIKPRLLPQSIDIKATYRDGNKKYFASAVFHDYGLFYTGEVIARDDFEVSEPDELPTVSASPIAVQVAAESDSQSADLLKPQGSFSTNTWKPSPAPERLLKRFRFWRH